MSKCVGVHARIVFVIQLVVAAGTMILCSSVPVSAQPDLGTWSSPIQISSTELDAGEVCGQTLYAYGWANLAISDDSGASWNPEIPFDGSIDVVDYVLHRVNRSVSYDLLYTKSLDNGSSWTDPVLVMPSSGWDGFYDVEAVEGVLIVYGWSAGGIGVSRSVDGGITWSAEQLVDTNVIMTDPEQNDIVYCNGKVYIAYSNDTGLPYPADHKVVIVESSDLGMTWGDRREIASGRDPVLRADGNTLYVTYWGPLASDWGLCFSKSLDGDSWEPGVIVAHPTQYTDPSGHDSLAVLGGRVFVSYILFNSVGADYYYWTHMNYSADDGSTWEDLGDVTGGDGGELYPYLMITPTTLHFMWTDNMGSGYWGGVTFYRSLTFDEPIPEFGGILVPVLGIGVVVAIVATLSRRRL